MRKFFCLAALEMFVLLFVTAAFGQTLSPVRAECAAKKCSGSFTIRNNSLQPLAVTVEPHSFSLDAEGHSVFRAVDAGVDANLAEMSSRVSPKATHEFSYTIHCLQAPCSVAFVSTMAVGRTADGIQVRVALPFSVYACNKAKNCRASVRRAAGLQ